MQQQREMQEQQLQARAQEEQLKREYESMENDKERQKDVEVAQIRSAGYGAMVDINENKRSDYQDEMENIRRERKDREKMDFQREQAAVKNSNDQAKLQIKREELSARREIADKQLQIARENKNRFDVKGDKKSEN